ncbi:MAG: PAS domain S-box protein [Myxococcales bacterium]|nr:PAS domain S-box protein [Myxococcales bacterium]
MASSKRDILESPTPEQMLQGGLDFGRTLFVDQTEEQTAERFVALLGKLFPKRHFMLRLVDLRGEGVARSYSDQNHVRRDLNLSQLRLRQSSIDKTHIKDAVAHSAMLRVSDRWDSPFSGVADGFALPLAIAGELYGVLDVGYPLGCECQQTDEERILPLANQLASALRNERLHHDTQSLRDYQSRLIEHASALILGIDSNWRIRVCNKALCDRIGMTSSELIGKDLRDHFPVADRNQLARVFADGMLGNDGANGKSQLIAQSGRTVEVVWRVASIRSRGAVQAVVAVGQDQTVLSDLQKQLVQAEKLSTLGQISAGVVHELNNPLTAIGVYSDFLLRKAEKKVATDPQSYDADDLAKLRTIAEGADRIKMFTRDLIQYARPSAGEPERLSMNQVINQSLSFCEHLFSKSGVRLERNLDQSIPDIQAVPGQLEQVVINLITNAVQACPSGTMVEVSSYVDEASRVIFSVKDQGPGISSEDQARIFEPFYTTKISGEGTGLGLCIVRNIIEDNSGELSLHSSLGQGAEFRCSVPAFARPD